MTRSPGLQSQTSGPLIGRPHGAHDSTARRPTPCVDVAQKLAFLPAGRLKEFLVRHGAQSSADASRSGFVATANAQRADRESTSRPSGVHASGPGVP